MSDQRPALETIADGTEPHLESEMRRKLGLTAQTRFHEQFERKNKGELHFRLFYRYDKPLRYNFDTLKRQGEKIARDSGAQDCQIYEPLDDKYGLCLALTYSSNMIP